ncbi:MAG: DUF3108 domain-containing protein [Woeseiaceae bacterium]|jgi:hypothetical protein
MNRSMRRFVTLLIVLTTPATVAAQLTPHKAEYEVRISIVSGQLNTELRRTEDGYKATHVVKATGLSKILTDGVMMVTSEFSPVEDGVRAVTYHTVDTVRNEPEAKITFDWASNVARGTVGDEPVELPLEGISHDAVSIQYELMDDLLNKRYSDTYVLFDIEKMRVAHVRIIGRKSVKTAAGEYDVVGIQHQKEGSSRVTTLWCAPELDYLPVLIEQHRKDKLNFRASLTSYEPLEDAPLVPTESATASTGANGSSERWKSH